jgi:hypothetical protein
VRGKPAPAISYLALDGAELPSRLAHLSGAQGWWFVYRFEIPSGSPPERLVHVVLVNDGAGYRALGVADGEAIARLPGREAPGRSPSVSPVAAAQERALAAARDEVVAQAHDGIERENDRAREKAMRYAEDCLLAPREAVEKARARLAEARLAVLAEEEPALLVRARGALERADRESRRRMAQLRQDEDRHYADLDRTLTLLAVRGRVNPNRTLIATAYFWIE